MRDIVDRLHRVADTLDANTDPASTLREAATEITRLRTEATTALVLGARHALITAAERYKNHADTLRDRAANARTTSEMENATLVADSEDQVARTLRHMARAVSPTPNDNTTRTCTCGHTSDSMLTYTAHAVTCDVELAHAAAVIAAADRAAATRTPLDAR